MATCLTQGFGKRKKNEGVAKTVSSPPREIQSQSSQPQDETYMILPLFVSHLIDQNQSYFYTWPNSKYNLQLTLRFGVSQAARVCSGFGAASGTWVTRGIQCKVLAKLTFLFEIFNLELGSYFYFYFFHSTATSVFR